MYGASELTTASHPARTRRNALESDATLWFGSLDSPGAITAGRACLDHGRPMFKVVEGQTRPSDVAAWIEAEAVRVLNVAGNRESTSPGIGVRAERFLVLVFRMLARE